MNIGEATLERLLRWGVRPLTVQVQLSLLDRRPLGGLARFAMLEGVSLLAYGALAGGFIDRRWLGRPDPGPVPGAGDRFHAEYRAIIDAFGGWPLFQDLLGAVAAVAERHRVAMASVALRWVLDRPAVAATLVGASDPARAQAWNEVFAMRLAPADLAALDAVLARAHGPRGPVGGLERDPFGPMARAIAASRAASPG
jgi:aryl-alcohol dehydrogenase-like predicted oxidoreductase